MDTSAITNNNGDYHSINRPIIMGLVEIWAFNNYEHRFYGPAYTSLSTTQYYIFGERIT